MACMKHHNRELSQLIEKIETEMSAIGIWGEASPSAEALASSMPFCYDTLEFGEWLQWIFLPRIKQLIDQQMPLPGKCDIAPLAEVWLNERGFAQKAEGLLLIIREFDQLVSSG